MSVISTGQERQWPKNKTLYERLDAVCDDFAGEVSRAEVIGVLWMLMQDVANRNAEDSA